MYPTDENDKNNSNDSKLTGYVEQIEGTLRPLIKLLDDSAISPQEQNHALTSLLYLHNSLPEMTVKIVELESQFQHLIALAEIGSTINSSLETDDVLQIVIDTIIELTGAERAFLMLKDETEKLNHRVARNWEQETLTPEEVAISSTIVDRVFQSGKAVLTLNAKEDPRFSGQSSVVSYNLRSIICTPLQTKDQMLGVIYIDNRSQSGLFTNTDLSILEAFANQAAIALYNANLYQDLQKSYQLIQEAYNSTLKGWARALDLRDHATEEHTRRVTELTLQLAELLDIPTEEMLHIERGAILHDIGKMGIPDSILNKPGPLTIEERKIIEQHPGMAYEMLSQIKFLTPSLDIPYCHHEKWDGSGYPRQLKSREIPLAARIFAVVDVWDALTSDRPYRAARQPREVALYIKEQADQHFDPKIVRVFLKMIYDTGQL